MYNRLAAYHRPPPCPCFGNPLFENPDPPPPKDYAAPTLPENYASLNPEEKEYADELHRRRMLFYLYMIFNGKDNKDHLAAMRTPLLAQRQHPTSARESSGPAILSRCKGRCVVDGWGLLALEGHGRVECPVSFAAEKSGAFYEKNWFKGNILVEYRREQVLGGVSWDGWVRNEVFEEVVEKNQALKKKWHEMGEDDGDRALVEGFWPFDDREVE